jgi:hypothetical protein
MGPRSDSRTVHNYHRTILPYAFTLEDSNVETVHKVFQLGFNELAKTPTSEKVNTGSNGKNGNHEQNPYPYLG